MGGLQCGKADSIYVAISIHSAWHCMRAQKAGHNANRALLAQSAGHAQHLELGIAVQTVAGFDLEGGHALRDERIDPGKCGSQQFGLACTTRCCDGRNDPAARACDLFVTRAVQPHFEFAGAVAAVHDVCVAINQGRRDKARTKIFVFVFAVIGWQRGGGANPFDMSVHNDNCRILHQAIAAGVFNHRGGCQADHDQRGRHHVSLR